MAKITINNITFEPETQRAAFFAANLSTENASSSNYILLQVMSPLNKAQKTELANKGVEILEYVPDNTYLCYFQPVDLNEIRSLSFVSWVNVYMRGFKIPPALVSLPPGGRVRNLMEISAVPARTLSTTPKTVDIVFHENVDPNTIRNELATATHLNPEDLSLSRHKVRLTVQSKYLSDIADLDQVRNIEEVFPYKLHNDVARGILELETGSPSLGETFRGEGQIVAVADTGFDKGSTSDVHPAFKGRVQKLYPLGRLSANDPDGHGTHVAGSVLGDGNSKTLGKIQGTAPAAKLVFQSTLDNSGGLGGIPIDLENLFEPPYNDDNARIHTNSWGWTSGNGEYNSNSREVDEFVWSHRDCVICFSAGNEGIDRDADGDIDRQSITPPATAKNCITVGATENNRPGFSDAYGDWWPLDFPANPIASDPMANNPEGMVAFSSRGPTQDGRIKPDVVAPGTFILSTLSRAAITPGQWAPSSDPLYYYLGGTSMATPLVAGCVALVREYLAKEKSISTPSAALVKAMLINGAKDIAGQYIPSEASAIPNNSEGFGRVDMAATIGSFSPSVQQLLIDENTALDTGDEETHTVTVSPGSSLLKVTLVWTDYPGSNLVNDLDLIVRTSTGEERHGNISPTSTGFDRDNNVEQVIWEGIPSGNVDITVRAYRIVRSEQTFALVVRIT